MKVLYGEKKFASLAWKEIDAGRPVTLIVIGWKIKLIQKLLMLYRDYDRMSSMGEFQLKLVFSLTWRTFLSPSFIGLCNHARSLGMAVAAYEQGSTLEVRFEK